MVEKQGYKFSNLPMTRALAKLNKWRKKEMSNRMEKEIKPRFVKVWPFPLVEVQGRGVCQHIFDVDTLDSVPTPWIHLFQQRIPAVPGQ